MLWTVKNTTGQPDDRQIKRLVFIQKRTKRICDNTSELWRIKCVSISQPESTRFAFGQIGFIIGSRCP